MRINLLGLIPFTVLFIWAHIMAWKTRGLPTFYDETHYYSAVFWPKTVLFVSWFFIIIIGVAWAFAPRY